VARLAQTLAGDGLVAADQPNKRGIFARK
jgi:hypothetical protein